MITNQIASFGQNAGAGLASGINRLIDKRRYDEQMDLQKNRLAMMKENQQYERQNRIAEIERQNRAAFEKAEQEHFTGLAKAVLSAPEDQRQLVYEGGMEKANQMGFDVRDAPPYSPEAVYKLAGAAGVEIPKTKPTDFPSDVRSYEYYSQLPENQRKEFLNVKRAGQPLNLGDRTIYRTPSGEEQVYERGVPTEKTPEYQSQVETAKAQAKADVKKQVNAPKAAEKVRQLTTGVDNTISTIDKALDMVNWKTTGFVGKAMSNIAGTDAYTLKQTALTVRANIGFDRLQAMRDASPTGGALGQVAVQELEALQASISSLDQGLPPEQLAENLNRVKQHYKNWKDAVELSYEEQYGQGDRPDPITQHHLDNLNNGGAVKNPDGSVSTVRTIQVDLNGKPTLIPTVWDGQIVSDQEAVQRAIQSGVQWPTADTHEQLRQFDINIHKKFDKDLEKSQYGGEGPKKGTVEDGYEFLGGDPSDPKSWKKQ